MKQKDFEELIRSENKRLEELLSNKGEDYSKEGDCLSNFKKTAELVRILEIPMTKPEGVALFFMAHKILRLCNLVNKGASPKNETTIDSCRDEIGYTTCLKGLIKEREEKDFNNDVDVVNLKEKIEIILKEFEYKKDTEETLNEIYTRMLPFLIELSDRTGKLYEIVSSKDMDNMKMIREIVEKK